MGSRDRNTKHVTGDCRFCLHNFISPKTVSLNYLPLIFHLMNTIPDKNNGIDKTEGDPKVTLINSSEIYSYTSLGGKDVSHSKK